MAPADCFRTLFAALTVCLPAAAQLEPGSEPASLGPIGGSAISVAVRPNNVNEILVVQYTKGVVRSTDGGASFSTQAYGTGASNQIRDLRQSPTDPDTLFARDGDKLLKSTDFGANWTSLGLTALYNDLNGFDLAPTGDDILAMDAFNAYLSTDGGANWSVVLQVVPFSGAVLDDVRFAPSDASVAYISHSKGLYRSDDGGATFADTGPFDTWVDALAVSPTDPYTVFAGTNFNGLFVSTDGGVTVTSIVGPTGNAQALHVESDGLWYLTLQELYYSSDGGNNWLDATSGWPDFTPIPSVLTTAVNGVRYLGCESNSLGSDQTGGGLYRMPAGPLTAWEHIAFLSTPIRDVAIATPGGKRVAGFGIGVYSSDPGQDLEATSLVGFETYAVAIDPMNPTRWLSGGVGNFFDNAQLFTLTNDGASFVKTYERFGAGIVQDIEFDPWNPGGVMVGIYPGSFGNESIVRSPSSGNAWIEVPGTVGWATRAVAYDPHTPSRVLQLSDNNQWAESLNAGISWSALQPAWPGTSNAVLLEFDPFEPGVIYRGDAGVGLWRSDDDGASWAALGVGLHLGSGLELHPDVPGWLWVSDDQGQVLVSTDRGQTFALALDVPAGVDGSALALDTADGSMLVGSDGASAWNFPDASPVLVLGPGTAGSGGHVPHLSTAGLPQVGNPSFGLEATNLLGGAPAFLAIGLSAVQDSAFGGTVYAGTLISILALPAGGPAGVPGAGSYQSALPIPNVPALVGLPFVAQGAAIDAGAADPSGIVLSDGLIVRLHD